MSSTGIIKRSSRSERDMAMPMGTPSSTAIAAQTAMIASVCMA